MNNFKDKRILIFQQRGWALTIGHFLAAKLQAEGCRLAALTFKPTTHEFILNQKEVEYDLIISNDEIMSRPKDYLDGDTFSLEEICRELGVDSIWPIVMSLRNYVYSYKDKYYFSFKQNVSDEDTIDYIMAVYKCIRIIFKKFDPQIILTPNFVSFMHIMMNLYAKKRGIKMVGVIDSKIKGYYLFSHSYLADEGDFFREVDELNSGKKSSKNKDEAKKYIREFREQFKVPDTSEELEINKKKTLVKKIRHLLSPYYHIMRWYVKRPINFLESTGITPDWRPPRIILRDHYCRDYYIRFMNKFKYYPFERIKKYAYFPLQYQPEASIDVIAPFFSNQIETARLLAISLPDDYTLVVKEHPAMVGLRPPSYIKKISRTVNVKLVDYRIPTRKILERADLIISPNSTSLAEAAFLGKPAIQLGNLGTTLKLPNVFKHTDMTTISPKIKEALKANLKTEEYERQLENYVAAVLDAGFKYRYNDLWERNKGDKEEFWRIYRKEIENVFN